MKHHRRRHDDVPEPEDDRPGPFMRFFKGLNAQTIAMLVLGLTGAGGATYNKVQSDERAHHETAARDSIRAGWRKNRLETQRQIDSLKVALRVEKRHVRALERKVFKRPLTADDLYGPPEPPAVVEEKHGRVWHWLHGR